MSEHIDAGRLPDAGPYGDDDAMTRSEEHLRVGTRSEPVGRARLRKYVVTELESVTVTLRHEEVHVERTPIGGADAGRYPGTLVAEENEVTLHAERPVARTEAVPVERVRLGTELVTGRETVTGEVRQERIELEDETAAQHRR